MTEISESPCSDPQEALPTKEVRTPVKTIYVISK